MYVVDTYGFDPAPTHGALVRATWQIGPAKLLEYSVIYEWINHPGTDRHNPQAMRYLVPLMIEGLKRNDVVGELVGVDYDSTSLFWGGHPEMAVGLAYTLGYFDASLKDLGLRLILISPRVVRHYFGETVKASKASVWKHLSLPRNQGEDVKDALVLSYIVAAMEDVRDVSPPRSTRVLGKRTQGQNSSHPTRTTKVRSRV